MTISAPPRLDAHTEMLRRYGRRPTGTCEACANLRATAGPRPTGTGRALTTFACDVDGRGTPWSVTAQACGAFEQA